MNFITTTDLRTKSSDLISSLKRGQSVSLIHRSGIVGKITPTNNSGEKVINVKRLVGKIRQLSFPKLSEEAVKKRYKAAMLKKHGKDLF